MGFQNKLDWLLPLFFVTTIVLSTPVPNLKAQLRIDRWTTDNGLPQNSVTGIARTPDGYIWFTTNEGLVRFDGVRFKVFNRSNTPEITNNRMSGAFADKSGTIWMSTEEGGILCYEKGVFKIAMKPGEIRSGLPSAFFQDPSGHVIFYAGESDDKRLTKHYRYQNGKFVPLTIEGLPADSYLVLTDREGGLWFGGGNALRHYQDGVIKIFDLREVGNGDTNRRAYEDRLGGVWIGYTDTQKNFLLRIKDGRIDYRRSMSTPITYFSEDAEGNLWVSVLNNGIYRIARRVITADAPVNSLLEPVLLVDKVSKIGVGYLCPDNERGMWVGTNEGLLRLMPQTIRVFSKSDGLPEDNVYPVYEDKAGRIWAGIWENSLVQFEHGSFKTVLKTQDTYYPTSLFEDRSGRFWIGTAAELYYLDKGRLVKFTQQAGFSPETEFSVISEDRDNNLWFGTSAGLSRYSGTLATLLTKKDGLPDDYIIAFLQAADGQIWVGTRGGLAAIENGKIKAFTIADGLASNYIRSLYEDSEKVLWIGSYDGGLTRFKDGKFTRFTMKEGLSSNGVFCILEDKRGWFWMNSNQGIYRVRRQELNDLADRKISSVTSIAYGQQDGLLNVEGNGGRQPAGVKARDGKLWFPTAQGVAVVDPDAVVINELPPPILIEEIVVDRNPVVNETFQLAIHNESEIVLAPNQRNLEISYTGISFINSGQLKFKYKLEGLDRDWNDIGSRRTAYYSYLPPGEYTFHVIAANRDGVWNTAGAFVKVRVLPPFYKTNWFIAACAIAFLALLWTIHRLRVRQLAHEFNMTLEARVGERTRIARDLHDTLLQSFQGLLLRFQAASNLLPARPLEAKQRLDSAVGQAAEAITEGRDAVQGLRSSAFETNDLANAITAIAQQLTSDLSSLDSPAIDVKVEGNAANLNPVVRDEAYRIAGEAVRNAFRHAQAQRITVEIRYDKRHFHLTVRDDGKGFDEDAVRRQAAGHFGLPGMRERAEIVGGRLEIWSRLGSGTEVELSVPGSVAYEGSTRDSVTVTKERPHREQES
jgi:signal transduction histidine kinase/ligand-binding sensor domain-containing protein